MRIEDLDRQRCRGEHEAGQVADLRAIGLDWDGEVVRQSERGALYDAALARLDTYPCFCTRREIREAASAPHGVVALYPGTCRALTAAQRAERMVAGRPPALRLCAEPGARIAFEDAVAGGFEGPVDDVVVRRNDGAVAYNLAVVVDDGDQGVDEVVRGADLLDATPSQIALQQALGLPRPRYAHVPLLHDADGERLSKRGGGATLAERPEAPEEVAAMLLRSVGLPGDLDAARSRYNEARWS